MNSKIKNVAFIVSDFKAGTNVRRGERIVKYLKLNGFECNVYDHIPQNIKNTILVFIGSFVERYNLSPQDIENLKKEGNKIILDPVDKLTYIQGEKRIEQESIYFNLLDGIIFPNKFSEEHFMQNLQCISTTIYHQYDPRFDNQPIQKINNFEICYVGVIYPDTYLKLPPSWLQITNIGIMTDVNIMLDILRKSPIHFSHRENTSYDFYFKPTNKLASAAATNSVFLTSKDKAVVELLGEDYPLYIDEDRKKTDKLVEYLKEQFGKDNLGSYIDEVKKVKSKLDINNICLEYIDFFKLF